MRLTREEAEALVARYGGVRPAARATGIDFSVIWAALEPERRREQWREASRRRRQRLKDAGLCTNCGREPLLSESLCWGCLNRLEDNRE